MFIKNRLKKLQPIIPHLTSVWILFCVSGCEVKTNIVNTEQEKRTNTLISEPTQLLAEDSLYSTSTNINEVFKLELPATNPEDYIVSHHGFSLLYNEAHEQSGWVAYELTKEKATKLHARTDRFIPDPKVITITANNKDYAGSGYDRGHLAPAADMGWSATSMAESFYYSNMSPQVPGFNRGIWKKLEERVREWAVENESMHIVTGPVLTEGLRTIGPNAVSVPEYFYKVILDNYWPEIKGIGFIIANTRSNQPLYQYAVSIDSVEKFTGIDFFPMLPDELEDSIEQAVCISCWSWGNDALDIQNIVVSSSTATEDIESEDSENNVIQENSTDIATELHPDSMDINERIPVQCSGITLSGNRCKRTTLSPEGKCHLHGRE